MAYNYIHKPKVRCVYIRAYNRLGGELLETFDYVDLPMKMVMKWSWFFKYRHAFLQVKYPKGYVETVHLNVEPEGRSLKRIEADRVKRDITTCRRMITKINNAIIQYENLENQKLIPHWDNPKYLKVKEKLSNYKIKLVNLLEYNQ